ncbi:hypothetical protein KJ969_03655 [Patescibacteria group bacterium]|nr:hypothetical protein [Patescibacteria group bacterium]MBU1921997.1 hypothetical protein [Patescibacteria group bacterium]
MKKITVIIEDGKLDVEFDNFPGDTCSEEENVLRLLLAKMGMQTQVLHSDNKAEPQANHIAEIEKIKS